MQYEVHEICQPGILGHQIPGTWHILSYDFHASYSYIPPPAPPPHAHSKTVKRKHLKTAKNTRALPPPPNPTEK